MKICVVGLGYVGLPLCIELSKEFEEVLGFDISEKRVKQLRKKIDSTNEVSENELASTSVLFSNNPKDLSGYNFFIVCVPTPINESKDPDLGPLIRASETVGEFMPKNSIIVFESTVFPGATEDVCVPVLESKSGFIYKKDFNVGYSPERINPGDKERTIRKIKKIVSGDTDDSLKVISKIYSKIIDAGIVKAKSIKAAEAAKVLENTQRDINIGLMNEFSNICNSLELNTKEVLDLASTKWNFLNFFPGLVGGHCIGIDPYYLSYIAKKEGLDPKIILSARETNDNVPSEIIKQIKLKLEEKEITHNQIKICFLGVTFKENVPDTRNSLALNLAYKLKEEGFDLMICDPNVKDDIPEIKINSFSEVENEKFDILIIAVPHKQIMSKNKDWFLGLLKEKSLLVDIYGAIEGLKSDFSL
tara:strand:+ start:3835 stop:5088 length:1254 start_codon:yes stop_codon:yes gene_type:complete